ncbi:hypothetical protein EN816_00755 [Mesorhizobium sp. M8A.F.Ca.ET.173.01.1.1]|nr:hypothetical protein EN816_00755 [Mesorhizobium sp. M8A.F.Ca.ET.173.01.1.1]
MTLLRSPIRSQLRSPVYGPLTGAYGSAPLTGTIADFAYDIDFVAGTSKVPSGPGQVYGNNTNDGRPLRDPNNVTATYIPNASGTLVLQASAGLRRTNAGHYQYPSYGTCRNLWARDLTNVVWVSGGGGGTSAKTSTGADGVANAATRLTASGANATWLQSITLASSTVLIQLDLRRITGTGGVDVTVDGGTTWFSVTPGSGVYSQVVASQAAVTNPVVGIRLQTSGDAVDVDFVNIYSNPPNSLLVRNQYRIATTSATILGSQSRPSADIADAGTMIFVAQGAFAFYWQGRSERATGAFIITGATGVFCSVLATGAGGAVKFSDGPGTSQTADSVWRTGLSQVNKVAGYVTAGGAIKVAANGVLGNAGTGATLETALDHFDLGTNGAGANSIYGINERFAMGANLTFTDAQLQAMTT